MSLVYTGNQNGTNGGSGDSTYVLEDSGRVYLYNNERWVTPYDDQYGFGYYQNAESAGTGPDPLEEWEHMGRYVRAGTIVHELSIIGRINDATNQQDLRIWVGFRAPNPISRWDETGFDGDSEDVSTEMFNDLWLNPEESPLPYPTATGAVNDQYRRTISFDPFICPTDGYLMLYFKAISNPTGDTETDYFFSVRNWLLSHPAN